MCAENFLRFQNELSAVCRAASRDPASITLVAVTKNHEPAEINELVRAGIKVIGENRIQEALAKFPHLLPCERHFIGHLQSNKAREAVANFDCIQSVDSLRLAKHLSIEAFRLQKQLDIFLQVNIAREETKFGFTIAELPQAIDQIRTFPALLLRGLMTIGPHTTDEAAIRSVFQTGRDLATQYGLPAYSAGMSDDWPLAVAAGATHLRIGRALFVA